MKFKTVDGTIVLNLVPTEDAHEGEWVVTVADWAGENPLHDSVTIGAKWPNFKEAAFSFHHVVHLEHHDRSPYPLKSNEKVPKPHAFAATLDYTTRAGEVQSFPFDLKEQPKHEHDDQHATSHHAQSHDAHHNHGQHRVHGEDKHHHKHVA